MKWLKRALISLIILSGLLSIGAKGCAWTNQDPDVVTGSSGEPRFYRGEPTPDSVQSGSSTVESSSQDEPTDSSTHLAEPSAKQAEQSDSQPPAPIESVPGSK